VHLLLLASAEFATETPASRSYLARAAARAVAKPKDAPVYVCNLVASQQVRFTCSAPALRLSWTSRLHLPLLPDTRRSPVDVIDGNEMASGELAEQERVYETRMHTHCMTEFGAAARTTAADSRITASIVARVMRQLFT
jgi:hypothetical protein